MWKISLVSETAQGQYYATLLTCWDGIMLIQASSPNIILVIRKQTNKYTETSLSSHFFNKATLL